MMDVVLEVSRTGILLLLVIYLWRAGSKHAELSCKGWCLILAGSCLLLFGSAIDITDNFESLNRFQVIGNTPLEAFLEKIVGSLLGFLLLTLGLLRWIPMVTSVETTRGLTEELTKTNRRLQQQTGDLEAEITERNRIKETLQQTEEQYRGIFESTTECLLVIDLDGTVVEANPAACRTYGYKRDEMVGMTGKDFVHPDHYSKFEDFKRQLQTSDHFYAASVDLRKDGSAFDIEVRGTTFQFRGKPHLLAVIQDVTQRKRAEEAFFESHNELNAIYDSMLDGVLIADIEARRFVRANPSICRMLGYSQEELLNIAVTKIHPPESLSSAMRTFQAIAEGRESSIDNLPLLRKNGTTFYADVTVTRITYRGRPCLVGLVRDVTQRKEAEEALDQLNRELEKRVEQRTHQLQSELRERKRVEAEIFKLAKFPDENPNPVLRISGSGIVAYANQASTPLLHAWETHEGERLPDEHRRVILDTLQQRHARQVEVAWKNQVFSVVLAPIPDADYVNVYALDITQRKAVEIERERLIAELELKNGELERFAYTVSHDLKSPLITIKGYLGLLQQDLAEGNAKMIDEDLGRISRAADTMHLLLGQVLELSRVGRVTHPTEDIAFDTLAHEAISLLGGSLAKKPAEILIADNLPVLHGDRARLLEVVQNLVENALKYMGDQPHPRIEIGSRKEGDEVACYVRDNGMGIDPAYHTKVFGLFDQLDQKVEGSGVGLAIVKRIVEIHGGRIWVESEGLGKGTTFCFTVPLAKAVATTA